MAHAGTPTPPRTSFEVHRTAYETAFLSGQRNPVSPQIDLEVSYDHNDHDRALRELTSAYEEAAALIESTRRGETRG